MRVLYISYNGLGEPLVHTQVLPYLAGLNGAGHALSLLTYERHGAGPAYLEQQAAGRARLEELGIPWRALRYHKWPSALATLYDILAGFTRVARLVRRDRIDAIHARSYVPAVIGWWVRRLFGVRLIFDMRGLMADEYVDAGTWRPNGVLYGMTKTVERRLLRAADEVVVLTDRVKSYLETAPDAPRDLARRITVIPCCVEEGRFDVPQARRERAAPVLVYIGSVGTWYLLDEMLDFFAAARELEPDLTLLMLNHGEHAVIERAIAQRALSGSSVRIAAVRPADVPTQLAAADAALSFIKPTFSKSASSPTKFAEYLAAGLPVVVNAGVGDVDVVVREHQVGVVVRSFTPAAYREAWRELRALFADGDLRARCRRVAREYFSVRMGTARYDAVYRRVLPSSREVALPGSAATR